MVQAVVGKQATAADRHERVDLDEHGFTRADIPDVDIRDDVRQMKAGDQLCGKPFDSGANFAGMTSEFREDNGMVVLRRGNQSPRTNE